MNAITNKDPGFLKAMADIEKDEPCPELQQQVHRESMERLAVEPELHFHPRMTLHEASKIAHSAGRELHVSWNGGKCLVTAVRFKNDTDYVPMFLRPQAE